MLENEPLLEFTPWEVDSVFKPAILFGMAKQHKRATDPMAYRWITGACSDISKPLSDEALRILTFLWDIARDDCDQLWKDTGAKAFWSIDSLDIVPLNADVTECRPNRQPSAFDLEKCFESIPITNTEHSLISRISCFLDLVWKEKQYVSSEKHPWKPGPKQECFWSDDTGEFSYIKERVLELCLEVTKHAIVTVGNCASLQAVGIPMDSVSLIFLNIYMFIYEYEFSQEMIIATPHMIIASSSLAQCRTSLSNLLDKFVNIGYPCR